MATVELIVLVQTSRKFCRHTTQQLGDSTNTTAMKILSFIITKIPTSLNYSRNSNVKAPFLSNLLIISIRSK